METCEFCQVDIEPDETGICYVCGIVACACCIDFGTCPDCEDMIASEILDEDGNER